MLTVRLDDELIEELRKTRLGGKFNDDGDKLAAAVAFAVRATQVLDEYKPKYEKIRGDFAAVLTELNLFSSGETIDEGKAAQKEAQLKSIDLRFFAVLHTTVSGLLDLRKLSEDGVIWPVQKK